MTHKIFDVLPFYPEKSSRHLIFCCFLSIPYFWSSIFNISSTLSLASCSWGTPTIRVQGSCFKAALNLNPGKPSNFLCLHIHTLSSTLTLHSWYLSLFLSNLGHFFPFYPHYFTFSIPCNLKVLNVNYLVLLRFFSPTFLFSYGPLAFPGKLSSALSKRPCNLNQLHHSPYRNTFLLCFMFYLKIILNAIINLQKFIIFSETH